MLHQFSATTPVVGPVLVTSPITFKIIAVLLAAGTLGNLCSYIGSAIDVFTNEKTIFDLIGCVPKMVKAVGKNIIFSSIRNTHHNNRNYQNNNHRDNKQ